MNLEKFNGKCVRITDKFGDEFEGVCEHLPEEYCMHEFGTEEEALQIVNFVFYKSLIKKIKSLEGHTGPYGMFSAPYGKIEEINLKDGADTIEDNLFCEDDGHTLRMLRCLEANADFLPEADRIAGFLRDLTKYSENEEIKEMSLALLERIRTSENPEG